MPTTYPKETAFVRADLDASRWEAIEPLVIALLQRPVRTPGELERWLLDRSELEAACSESKAQLYITMTCFTDDEAAQSAYTAYVESVPPRLAPAMFELDKRQVELVDAVGFASGQAERYAVLDRATRADVKIFRPENVPIQTELSLLSQKYDQVVGAMTVQFDGREQTLPQMAKYLEMTDRATREGAWRGVAERRAKDKDAIHDIYEAMIQKRHTMARNAGFQDFVGYAFESMHRFDYTPKHCFDFHAGVEKHVVPLARRIDENRRKSMGLSELRPWDLSVDAKGRAPLRPFEGGRDLMGKSVRTFEHLDPRLGAMLSALGDGSNTNGPRHGASLDLDSRRGKGPGGYQYMRDRTRRPFIFMNAAGLARDAITMLHEAGHAFHSTLCVDEPLIAYRHSPIEFAEVASMTMELLCLPHLTKAGSFYEGRPEDSARHVRQQLERSVTTLAWIATIDAFQHWVYSNPAHTRGERARHWLSLDDRFGSRLSWTGIEPHREIVWQRQLHLFGIPFYYIEYGIAQLGALGLWLHSLEKGEKSAVEAYLAGLRLGGSKPLPELFAAAGLKFDFGPDTIGRIVERAAKELEKLPE